MKRLYYGGKAVLKTEINKICQWTGINFLLLLIFVPAASIVPQIPVNGFCKYSHYPVQPGFTSIFTANYNKDSYTDLILFNPVLKDIFSLEGKQAGVFGTGKVSRVSSELSHLYNLTGSNNTVTGYAFTSRKTRKAGILELTKDGRVKFLQEIKFSSYPENLSAADINGDGLNEFLISGAAFDGLSVVSLKDGKLFQQQVTQGTSYSNAVFSDISNDGFSDIAAPDVYSNNIDIFYNNSRGSFKKIRTIPSGSVNYIKASDINLDYFEDLVYSSGSKIVIAYGDAASSFELQETINTAFVPDKILSGDYNKDGRIDLAYANFNSQILSLVFAKESGGFYPEIFYMKQEGIRDIVPYYSKFISGIAGLTGQGKLFVVSHITSFSGEVNISLGVQPSAINYFDYDNNGITDICFIDNNDQKLKLVLRNSGGLPYSYYSFPLYEKQVEILIDDSEARIKTFYCYSPGRRLIEALTYDFNSLKFSRQSLYSPGSINEIKLSSGTEDKKIYTSYIKNNELGLSVVSYHDFRYTSLEYPRIAEGIASACISLSSGPSVYYWQTSNNHITLSRYSLEEKNSREIVNAVLPGGKINSVTSFTGDLLNTDKDVSISFFDAEKNDHVIIASDEMTRILQAGKIDEAFTIPSKNDLYFGNIRSAGLKKLVYYDPVTETASKLDFIDRGRNFIVTRLAEIGNPADYFIKNMSYKKYHIIYTNKTENCITIKEI